MIMDIFLVAIGLIWILIASIQDLKKREVYNWLSFSLIGVALSYRLFYSILSGNWSFLLYGILGLIVFFALSQAFYYGKVFAGGDAKLLIAIGAVIPVSSLSESIIISGLFIIAMLFAGGIYGLIYSLFLALREKKFYSEFGRQIKKRKGLMILALIVSFVLLVIIFMIQDYLLLSLCVIILLLPLLFSYAKAVEETCMVKEIKTNELTVGDWLYENLMIKGKKIKANWEGISEAELKFIKKNYKGKIMIKQGIPFVPSFLFAFLIVIIFYSKFKVFF